jgi:hypothetical protein
MKSDEDTINLLFAGLAQAVINIDSGHNFIEKDSHVYKCMVGLCELHSSGVLMRNPNVPAESMSIKDRKLFIAAAIELLGATRDNESENTPGRWKYYAEETQSYWSVTGDALAELGKKLDGKIPAKKAYEEWAEKDTTAIEMKGRRRG